MYTDGRGAAISFERVFRHLNDFPKVFTERLSRGLWTKGEVDRHTYLKYT